MRTTLGVFVAVIAMLYFVQVRKEEVVESYSSSHPAVYAEGLSVLADYKARRSPVKSLSGLYKGEAQCGEGRFSMSYFFDDGGVITKSIFLYSGSTMTGNVSLTGSASYTIHGSALLFSDFSGAKGLFPLEGEPFDLDNDVYVSPFYYGDNEDCSIKLIRTGA